jgi:carbon monoxide dehydrogenase subunit G
MQLSGSHQFSQPVEEVWRTLYNPRSLRRALPGCKEFDAVSAGEYRVKLVLGFAFIKSLYTGSVRLADVAPPNSYTLHLSGKGPLGGAVGKGSFRLEPSDDGRGTVVSYVGDVQVSGRVAALGHSVIKAGAHLAIGQFFSAMEREIRRTALADDTKISERDRLAAG